MQRRLQENSENYGGAAHIKMRELIVVNFMKKYLAEKDVDEVFSGNG